MLWLSYVDKKLLFVVVQIIDPSRLFTILFLAELTLKALATFRNKI